MTGGWRVRPLEAGDDLEAELDLRHRAFGLIPAADRPRWVAALQAAVAEGRLIGVFDGSCLIGSARFSDMRQWWHGRPLPMAGVAGVKIAPERRGQGIGTALMQAVLAEVARRGYPISVLYPATASIYRSLGWEVAAARYLTELPASALARLLPPDVGAPPGRAAPGGDALLRRAGRGDAAEVAAVLGAAHTALRDCGAALRDVAVLGCWLADPRYFAYLAPDGFLSYRWAEGHDQIVVSRAVAASGPTARAIWGVVASHASMASTVRACIGPADPLTWLTRETGADLVRRRPWMLRLVDAPAAFAARGFPAAARLTTVLRLSDQDRPANAGEWLLAVSEGRGSLTPAGTAGARSVPAPEPDPAAGQAPGAARGPAGGPVTLGARGLAALFAGVPMSALRRAGLAAGGGLDGDAALDCAFAADAFMADYF